MRRKIKFLAVALFVMLSFSAFSQSVGINSDGSSPNSKAMLDVSSTTKGFLPPRMTYEQMLAISYPPAGLIVWCSNCGTTGVQVYNGTAWTNLTGGTASGLPGAPTIGTATAGDAQASVPFTAPASDGGSTILSYTAATSSPGGLTGTLTQAGSGTITVTGLTNGTAYTFTVTATNARGTSAASAASNSVTPAIIIPSVTNPTTGKIWMDRNLGASQVATSSDDAASYGDFYQWGRATDGHEKINSVTTTDLSISDTPGHGNFIIENTDWRSTQKNNLWQGVNGINNPCPSGYRLPTVAEFNEERATWVTQNAAGAFGSPLKLPLAGYRGFSDGGDYSGSLYGYYWSSNLYEDEDYSQVRVLLFTANGAEVSRDFRANGFPVRCIKD